MSEITKPSGINLIWASGGDKLDPGNSKYQTGWGVELPPRQWENFVQNKQDQAIAHFNQHGVPSWDSDTEYQANKSYVQGFSDGVIYRCVQTHTNQNPETDVTNTYWVVAFASLTDVFTRTGSIATTAEAKALTSNTTLMSPLRTKEAFNATGSAPLFAARAWGTFNGTPATPTGTWGNVTSVTKVAAGIYNVKFATPMSSTGYAISVNGCETVGGQNSNQDVVQYYGKTVNGFTIECLGAETIRTDFVDVSFIVFGN